MKTKCIALALIIAFAMMGCASGPQTIPKGCEDSVIVNMIPNYREVDVLLSIANIQAIKRNVYTKEQALQAIDELSNFLLQDPSYIDFLGLVMSKINWVNEHAGIEVFILGDYANVFDRTTPISICDKDLLLQHLQKQKVYVRMLREEG